MEGVEALPRLCFFLIQSCPKRNNWNSDGLTLIGVHSFRDPDGF